MVRNKILIALTSLIILQFSHIYSGEILFSFLTKSHKKQKYKTTKIDLTDLENKVPQSHLYSLVPQTFKWAFQSDWTAYFFAHLSHFHFFSPCFLQKCFFIPVKSPKALDGSWCTQDGSGQTYTRFRISFPDLCRSFHGRLCPLRWSCKFWSLWNPLLQISHTNRFVANRDFGDRAITSASGSAKTKWILIRKLNVYSLILVSSQKCPEQYVHLN